MINKYELIEINILKYLYESGAVSKLIGSAPGWNKRFASNKWMELPTILVDMFEKEYFDISEELNDYRIALQKYRYSSMQNYRIIKEKLEKEFNLGVNAVITAKGISYLSQLEDKMSSEEIQPQVIQQFFAPVKNVTASGDIHNTEIVVEKIFSNLIDRIQDLQDEKKNEIKRQLPQKVKEFARSISIATFSALLNWFLSNVKP